MTQFIEPKAKEEPKPRRFVACLRRPDGSFEQVSDYAENFALAEDIIGFLYVRGQKNPRDPFKLQGATIERIVFDDYAETMPPYEPLDYD